MLVARAYTKYIRISPRKLRLAIDLIRGERANQALVILANLNKKARICVEKTLKSALSNAGQNPAINTDELFISKITADNGPMLKRYRAAAMGRAVMIRHRTSHLTVELSKIDGKIHQTKQVTKAVAAAAKAKTATNKTTPAKKSGGSIPVDKLSRAKQAIKPKRRIRR